MPMTRVNDIDVNYKLEGDGPETIVLINGLADGLESWAFQRDDFLGAGYRVLRFDNRGIGASSKPAGPYSSRMLADDAKALVDSLGITDFHLMGVSMGGMIAQEYALAYAGDLRSATPASGSTRPSSTGPSWNSSSDTEGASDGQHPGDPAARPARAVGCDHAGTGPGG
jgi:3-oxoadipate enol-lactonase